MDLLRELDNLVSSEAEQRVLELIDEILAADTDDISDDFMNSFVKWTALYLLHRIAGCPGEAQLRNIFIESCASLLGARGPRRVAIGYLVRKFHGARQHPSRPLDLLEDYRFGCESQRAQHLAQHDSAENDISAPGESDAVLKNAPLPCLEPAKASGCCDRTVRVSPCYSADLVQDILTHISQETITFLLSYTTQRLRLANPLRIADDPVSGYMCDSCFRDYIVVSFRATNPDDVRDAKCIYKDCIGFDMCIPCAVHFVYESLLRLRAALAAPPPLSRPFAVPNARLIIQSAARSGATVRLRVVLAPQSVRLCVWELPAAWANGRESPDDTLWALPLPLASWRDVCRVTSATPRSPYGSDGDCAVCQCPLRDSDEYGAVLETGCGHRFHAYCIETTRLQSPAAGCPVCRDLSYFEKMAKEWVYNAELTLRECNSESNGSDSASPVACVAVAALLTNVYMNPTNIVACEVIRLYSNSLLSCECQSPLRDMETPPFADGSISELCSLVVE